MNDLEKLTLQTIGEDVDSPDVFTSSGITPIRDSINDAIEEISMVTGASKVHYRIPLREGQTFYKFKFAKDRFAYITDAWLWSQKWRLEQTDFWKLKSEDPRWMTKKGRVERYFQIGMNVVGFDASPSNNDVVELKCVSIPTRYTQDTDRVKVRDSFKWAVVHFAASEYYATRGDKNEALMHHQKYIEALGIQSTYPDSGDKTYQRATR